MLPHHSLYIVEQAFQQGNEGRLPRVPHGHTDITQETAAFRAFKRCTPKALFKIFTAHASQVFQQWVHLGRVGLYVRLSGEVAFAIPRTDVLANIAAEDMVPHLWAKLFWNSTLELDSQIGNTAPGIEHVGFQERLGWAGLQAARACPAVVERRTVILQSDGQDKLSQQQP